MSFHKKRKYIALMAAGGVALVVDRLVLTDGATGPSAAVALTSNASTAPVETATAQGAIPSSIPELPFPRDLGTLDVNSAIRDLFAPPEFDADTGANGSRPDNGRPGGDGGDHTTGAMFVARHRLSAVLIRQGLRIAVIDKTWVRIGQTLEGCTLLSVSGNEALFECTDGRVVLNVIEPGSVLRD